MHPLKDSSSDNGHFGNIEDVRGVDESWSVVICVGDTDVDGDDEAGVEGVQTFADEVDEDGGRSVNAFLVETPAKGEVAGSRRNGDGTVLFLEVEGDGTSWARVTVDSDLADGGAYGEVFGDEEAF